MGGQFRSERGVKMKEEEGLSFSSPENDIEMCGGKFVPAEVGPQICLQCREFPKNSIINIYMKRIPNDAVHTSYFVFMIETGEVNLALSAYCEEWVQIRRSSKPRYWVFAL